MAAALFVALLLLAASLTRTSLEGALDFVVYPVLALRNTLGSSEAVLLRAEVASLEAKIADRDLLYRENIDLKARLGRPSPLSGEGRVLAAVLMRPPAIPYDTLLIDAGVKDGIAEGDLVYAGGSLLIGKISAAGGRDARVMLFSAPEGSLELTLIPSASPASGIPVSVTGEGGGSFTAEVPAGSMAAAGDYLKLPGIDDSVVARVARVERHEDGTARLHAHLPINPFELRYVEVWK